MITFRLHLIRCGERFLVGADTTCLAQATHVELGEAPLQRLTRIGQSFAAGHLVDAGEARRFGNVIFRSAVRGEIRDCYLGALARAAERVEPLRVVLSLPIDSVLNEVPWELMYDGDRFLACHGQTPLLRYIPSPGAADRLAVGDQLRILLTSASPEGVPPVDGRSEAAAVSGALDTLSADVELVVRHGVSRADLIALFQQAHRAGRPIHLWHHVGHGSLNRDDERLLLVLERDGKPEPAEAWSLAQLVRGEAGLRIAVLNLCFGASPLGLASHLARLGLPAVVGFRGKVLETEAHDLARHFYANLGSASLDLALARTRQALALDTPGLAWAKPLLFTRTEDLALWSAEAPADRPARPRRRRPRDGAGSIDFLNGGLQGRRIGQYGKVGGAVGSGSRVRFGNDSIRADEIVQVGEISLAEDEAAFERRFRELSERTRLWES